ncbi:MAG: MarR family transcriptional regulator [Acidimicrobiia bacterium]|nr:MarR family transcriptional regulator [Acidimicrobiia bacterium]
MTTATWLDDREQQAWRGLLAMQAKLDGRLRRSLQRDSGLSDADYAVLVNLSEAPGGRLRVFELVAALDWEKSRLSHQLRRMEQRGLLEREGCETDRRGSFVVLTEPGRRAIEAAAPHHVNEVRRWFVDALTGAQLEALTEITAAVLANLGADEAHDRRHLQRAGSTSRSSSP